MKHLRLIMHMACLVALFGASAFFETTLMNFSCFTHETRNLKVGQIISPDLTFKSKDASFTNQCNILLFERLHTCYTVACCIMVIMLGLTKLWQFYKGVAGACFLLLIAQHIEVNRLVTMTCMPCSAQMVHVSTDVLLAMIAAVVAMLVPI